MNRRLLILLSALTFVFIVSPAASYAQDAETTATADIGFKFIVDGKTMPAGNYVLEVSRDRDTIRLLPEGKGTGVILLTLTRLATPEQPNTGTRLVFDKVGNTDYLSEVWLPGEDGFLFYAAKEKHTHDIIKAIKKVIRK
jgi:hypothetical protein